MNAPARSATKIGAMPRVPTGVARSAQEVIDVGVLCGAYIAAFLVRFEGSVPEKLRVTLYVTLPIVAALQLLMLRLWHSVQRVAWRYVSLRDAAKILAAIGIATLMCCCSPLRTVVGSGEGSQESFSVDPHPPRLEPNRRTLDRRGLRLLRDRGCPGSPTPRKRACRSKGAGRPTVVRSTPRRPCWSAPARPGPWSLAR